ncbi:MAG: diacylglycerol kinase catalytic domain-containing protein [Candidatus Xenobia bacterium]
MYEKVVLITRKTRLEELIERFNSRGQARFYIEHAGGNFDDYADEDETYHRAVEQVRRSLTMGLKLQMLERHFLPTYLFTAKDLLVAVGGDGLVANTAKYAGEQPLVGVNPDPRRIAGILVPTPVTATADTVRRVLEGRATERRVTLGEVGLNDGQKLLAFNDFFIGARSHVSARYQIRYATRQEAHSSSGIIVSTGAGSTGWLSSMFNMAAGLSSFVGERWHEPHGMRLSWEDPCLVFVVREPFVSKHSSADIVAGVIPDGQELELESNMPAGGVIFSDGIEEDWIAFNSGSVAHVRAAPQRARLIAA